eukprot:256359_1
MSFVAEIILIEDSPSPMNNIRITSNVSSKRKKRGRNVRNSRNLYQALDLKPVAPTSSPRRITRSMSKKQRHIIQSPMSQLSKKRKRSSLLSDTELESNTNDLIIPTLSNITKKAKNVLNGLGQTEWKPHNNTNNSNNYNSTPKRRSFPSHMTLEEANKLQIHDKVDHRDQVGTFVYATVKEKQ